MPNLSSDQSMHSPDERLARAYRDARYVVNGFSLEIDVPQPDFDRWLASRGHHTYAVVTAHNPESTRLPAPVNAARHATLLELCNRRGLHYVPASNTDPAGDWPQEAGICLLDPPPAAARELGRIYQQHAIVEGRSGTTPALIWL